MSFQRNRALFRDDGTSTGSPRSTSERTRSDPRRPREEKEQSSGSNTSSKRRRVPESVTRNACLNCKRARAKCDGKQPCKRCASRGEHFECIYVAHIMHEKGELVKQIKELKAKNHTIEQILQALSNDKKAPEILDRLKNGKTYESIVEWLGRLPMEHFETLSPSHS